MLDRVLAALQKRFYAPEKLNGDWQAAVERHRPLIESANTPADFEKEVSDLLKELQTSHLGFFHRSARRASSRAALSATYLEDETEYGKRWIFQDVHAGGAASAAGIEPGDILLSVDDQNVIPPEHPVFTMGEKTSVEVVGADEKKRRVIVDVARPKGKKLHFVEPKLVEARHLNDGVGYLKIAMFPGLVGVEVAICCESFVSAKDGVPMGHVPPEQPESDYCVVLFPLNSVAGAYDNSSRVAKEAPGSCLYPSVDLRRHLQDASLPLQRSLRRPLSSQSTFQHRA